MTQQQAHQKLVHLKMSGSFERFKENSRKILTNSLHPLRKDFYEKPEYEIIDYLNLFPLQKSRLDAINENKGEIQAFQFFINQYLFNYDGLFYNFLVRLIDTNADLVQNLIDAKIPTSRRVNFENELRLRDCINKSPLFKIRFFSETDAIELLPYIDIPAEAQIRVYTVQTRQGNFEGMQQLISEVSSFARLNRLLDALKATYSRFATEFEQMLINF